MPSLSAVTLVVSAMAPAVAFYRTFGFPVVYGGETEPFTTLEVGDQFINLQQGEPEVRWGRFIVHVADPDAAYRTALDAGYRPEFPPRDAAWGERYFHLRDPDGHEVSFACPLADLPGRA
ncbi:MAG: VOC family protein [Acidimicrobiales bacterium]